MRWLAAALVVAVLSAAATLDVVAHPSAQEHLDVLTISGEQCLAYRGPHRRMWPLERQPELFDEECVRVALDAAGVGACVEWRWVQCWEPGGREVVYLGPLLSCEEWEARLR